MTAMVLDERLTDRLIAERREQGLDRSDEVWEGVYVMSPPANILHQKITDRLRAVLNACRPQRTDTVVTGVAVSPLAADWEHNYRVPDVTVVLAGRRIVEHTTHYQGGPDMVVEVVSPGDRTLDKLAFYASLGVREVLTVGRDSRVPMLYRLRRATRDYGRVRQVPSAGMMPVQASKVLAADFSWEIRPKGDRLLVRRTAGAARSWRV